MHPASSTANLQKILHIVRQFGGQFSVFIHLSPHDVGLWLFHLHLYGIHEERWSAFWKLIQAQNIKDYQDCGSIDSPALDIVVAWFARDLLQFMQTVTAPRALEELGLPLLESLISMLPFLYEIEQQLAYGGVVAARQYAQRKGY